MVNQENKSPLCAFSISCTGYSHKKSGKPCQDHSCHFQDTDRVIITACDGHGGSLYIRSQIGSRLASEAVCRVFGAIKEDTLVSHEKLRLDLLCTWNAAVEEDLSKHPFVEEELQGLSVEQRFLLEQNPFLAYGTTMHGAMILGNQLYCASIGDGGIFSIIGDEVVPIFEGEDEETVANVTHSMCEEHAGKHLQIAILDLEEGENILACTDGTVNPYHSLSNFGKSFVLPILREAKTGNLPKISQFMALLGDKIGIGDDVSLAMIFHMEEKQEQEEKPENPEETE